MDINELIPLEKNPFKSRGDKQIELIGKSIKDFNEMMSIRKIIIDENNTILGGNKRYFALKMLGYKEIPNDWIDKVEGLSEEKKREFIIKDNAHWGSEWDFGILDEWEIDFESFGVKFDDIDMPDDVEKEPVNKDLQIRIKFSTWEDFKNMEDELREFINSRKNKAVVINGGEL